MVPPQNPKEEMIGLVDERLLWERGEWVHLPEFVLVDYVNETLDPIDREIADGHLADCIACVTEVRDLRQLRIEIASRPTPVTVETAPGPTRSRPLLPRWFWPVLVGGGAIAVIVFLAALLPLTQKLSATQQQVARLQETQQTYKEQEAATQKALATQRVALTAVTQERDRLAKRIASQTMPSPAVVRIAPPVIPLQPALPTLPDRLRRLLSLSELPLASSVALQTGPVILRGDEARQIVSVVYPFMTRVLSTQPVFRWQPFAEADHYEVLIGDEKDTILARSSVPLRTTVWQPTTPLPRDRSLTWEVTALSADGKRLAGSATARFEIVPEKQATELMAARSRWLLYRPLVWAVIAAEAGLRMDAENALVAVLESPSSSEVDRKTAAQWLARLNRDSEETTAQETGTVP